MKFPHPIYEVYENTKIVDIENWQGDEAKLRLKKIRAEQMAGMIANKVYESVYAQLMAEQS